jgi:hypothetical protein
VPSGERPSQSSKGWNPLAKSRRIPLAALIFVVLITSNGGSSQSLSESGAMERFSALDSGFAPLAFHSMSDLTGDAASDMTPLAALPASRPVLPWTFRPFSSVGIDARAGLGGIGFDVATPLSRKFNIRAGSDFFGYSTAFKDQGANVAVDLRMRSGHASLDWFPFGGRFRLSPLVVFANNNRAQATASIPPGSTITLNGQDYISSFTDPLHGSGSVDLRKTSPGFTLGFGNAIPRTRSHLSFPVEVGFYYVGQPGLKVSFSGSACDPTQPAAIGCEPVDQDPGFQQDLAAFIARNNHNLSYASFFPIFSAGFGYAF